MGHLAFPCAFSFPAPQLLLLTLLESSTNVETVRSKSVNETEQVQMTMRRIYAIYIAQHVFGSGPPEMHSTSDFDECRMHSFVCVCVCVMCYQCACFHQLSRWHDESFSIFQFYCNSSKDIHLPRRNRYLCWLQCCCEAVLWNAKTLLCSAKLRRDGNCMTNMWTLEVCTARLEVTA